MKYLVIGVFALSLKYRRCDGATVTRFSGFLVRLSLLLLVLSEKKNHNKRFSENFKRLIKGSKDTGQTDSVA